MLQENDFPISVQFDFESGTFEPVKNRSKRCVSDMARMFADKEAVEEIINNGDRLVYEIWYYPFETSKSDMSLSTASSTV